MLKVRFLTLSSFAAGFGLCSIVFSIFTMVSEFNFASVLRFFLTALFFLINLIFVMHYYVSIFKEQKLIYRMRSQLNNPNYINYN